MWPMATGMVECVPTVETTRQEISVRYVQTVTTLFLASCSMTRIDVSVSDGGRSLLDDRLTFWCVACECDALGTQGNGNCAQESDVVQGTAQGDCQCKSNLIGQKCRMCKTGTWNLTAANRDGCEGKH